jgi:hypothetical protein
MAAAGLWTNPTDLCKYILEVQQSLRGKSNHVLSAEMTRQMVTPGLGNWGLGLEIGGAAANRYFSHGGVNEGFESLFVAYENGGDGAVVMTNAQGGSRLAAEVMSSIAGRTEVQVDREILARYVGTYQFTPQFGMTFRLEGNQLMTRATGQPEFPVFPESETKFFLKIVDAEVEFIRDDKGAVSYMLLHQGGHEMKGIKQ